MNACRVELHWIVGQPRVGRCCVLTHCGDAIANAAEVCIELRFGISGVFAGKKIEPVVLSHARPFLVAYNIYLGPASNLPVAKKIAKAVRGSSGGFRYVKGLGLEVEGQAQVSMNLVDTTQTPMHRVFDFVKMEAAANGVPVTWSEIVGLVLRDSAPPVLGGLAAGTGAAAVAAPVLSGLLFGVTAHDAASLAAGLFALAWAAFAASLVPARAAARIDPLVALRVD